MMRRLPNTFAVLIVVYCVILAGLYSCATHPDAKSPTQLTFSAGWTLTGAANGVADLHDAGTLKGADYDHCKAVLLQGRALYQTAEGLRKQGKPQDAATVLLELSTLLNDLSLYLAQRGMQ